MSRLTKVAMGAIAISLVAIITAIAWSSKSNTEHRAATLIEKVVESPEITINFTNFDGVPLTIKQATSKEISAIDYQQLTGEASTADRFASFPSVILLNSSNDRVTKLMLTVGNRHTKKWYVVTFGDANIAAQQTFSMSPADWRPDKLSAVGDQKQSDMS